MSGHLAAAVAEWRRHAATLDQLYTALAVKSVSADWPGGWSVVLADSRDLRDWLEMVVPAHRPDGAVFLLVWTSDLEADADGPLVYLGLSCPALPGVGQLQVLVMLDPPAAAAARSEHPRLREPNVELRLDRATWFRYASLREARGRLN